MTSSERIATPQVPALKPNLDIPKGVSVERQPSGGVNSPNQAGGYVEPTKFSK